MLYIVARSFAFSRVRHPELTPFLRWYPIVIACVMLILFLAMPVRPPLTGDGSISRSMISIFGILPGFYIAALAAVATFNRSDLDSVMPNPAPMLQLRSGRDEEFVELTFRMFMCQLFAYLTALSLLSVFFFVFAELGKDSIQYLINALLSGAAASMVALGLAAMYVFIVGWLSSTIVLTTMIGLYFLAERIHRP